MNRVKATNNKKDCCICAVFFHPAYDSEILDGIIECVFRKLMIITIVTISVNTRNKLYILYSIGQLTENERFLLPFTHSMFACFIIIVIVIVDYMYTKLLTTEYLYMYIARVR